MAAFELLAILYFLALAAASAATRVSRRRRVAVAITLAGTALAVFLAARTGSELLRAWLPHAYLLAGYWLPALLTPGLDEATAFERWLVASDLRLRPRLPGVPAAITHVTEVAYLFCYPLVPATFAIVWIAGTDADVSRYWVAVLGAGYACYVSLPWLLSRPPRLIGQWPAPPPHHAGAVNVYVLGRFSHQLNTFPSGHAAISLAAAIMLATVSPLSGAVAGAVAAAIAVGAAAGRYHYVVDVLAGIAVGCAAVAAAWMAGGVSG